MFMTTTTNFLVMLGAAIAAWLFGALWYGTLGRQWVAAQDTTMEAFKAKQAAKAGRLSAKLPFVLSFAAELLMAYVLYGLMKHVAHTNPLSVGTGIVSAIAVSTASEGARRSRSIWDRYGLEIPTVSARARIDSEASSRWRRMIAPRLGAPEGRNIPAGSLSVTSPD